jgi:tetratricopeptide (TPR) repeat protein
VINKLWHQLPEPVRLGIALEAVNTLAGRVQGNRNTRDALAEVRQARQDARFSNQHVDQSLKALEARLEHQARVQDLRLVLKQVQELGKTGDWSRAAERAQEALRKGQASDGNRPALAEIGRLGKVEGDLKAVQSALQAPARDRPDQAASALRAVKTERLPVALRQSVDGLRVVAELRNALERPWSAAPDVKGLSKALAEFQGMSGNKDLSGRLAQELAVKAFLEGFVKEARGLLPKDGPSDHARNLLRDMKALALGEGAVGTDPAGRAVAQASEAGNGQPPKPPPGVRPLIPEGPGGGWRPPVRDSTLPDLLPDLPPGERPRETPPKKTDTPLQQVARLEQPWRERAGTLVKEQRQTVQRNLTAALHRVQQAQQQLQQNDDEDDKFLAKVEAELKGKLTPAERALAWKMRRDGKKVSEIVTAIRDARRAEARARFALARDLAEAQKYDEADRELGKAIRLDDKYTRAYVYRADTHYRKKEYQKALADYQRAVEIDAKDPGNHNSLAWLLATCPDVKFRDGKKALEAATRACELASWKKAYVLDTLAAAYAEDGKYADAVRWQKKAVEIAEVDKAGNLKEYRERLKLYEQGKPFRDERK